MTRRNLLHLAFVLLALLAVGLLWGCGAAPTAPSAAATMAPSPTPGLTPLPTATATPEPTPTPRPTWQRIQELTLPEDRLPGVVRLSPDGQRLAMASWLDSNQNFLALKVHVWAVGSDQPLWDVTPGNVNPDAYWVDDIAWIPNHNALAVTINRWDAWGYVLLDAATGQTLWKVDAPGAVDDNQYPKVLWNPVTDELIANTSNLFLQRYALPDMRDLGRWKPLEGDTCCFFFNMQRTDQRMFAVGREAYVTHYILVSWPLDGQTGQRVDLPLSSNGTINDLAVNDQNQVAIAYWAYFAETEEDTTRGSVWIFDATTGQQVNQIRREYDFPEQVEWVKGQGWLIAWSNGEVVLYSTNGQPLKRLNMDAAIVQVQGVSASEDGTRIAVFGSTWDDQAETFRPFLHLWQWK